MKKSIFRRTWFLFLLTILVSLAHGEDGYRLWLRYDPIADSARLHDCEQAFTSLALPKTSPTNDAIKKELDSAFSGLLGKALPVIGSIDRDGALVIGTPQNSALIAALPWKSDLTGLGQEGYIIRSTQLNGHNVTVIASSGEIGTLYGTFALLRAIQTGQPVTAMQVMEKPALQLRMLDHWDNPDEIIERGYGGKSIWKWAELPTQVDPRLTDYARANASIGINAAVLNNVNAKSIMLTPEYLTKVSAIANVLRPYGIRVYLSIHFSSPIELGGLKTADPLDPGVIAFWKSKADEIYQLIPDFGGFLVKANSEGQPGPLTYHRTHADGANMLAAAVAPHKGIIMWRAFVYGGDPGTDRAAQAYDQLQPLDGQFAQNVLLQVKNGPIDFMPREPLHPLWGAMPKTQLMGELQITQEYLGHSNHLVYLGTMWKEFLDSDTFAQGPGSFVWKVLEGKLSPQKLTGIAGVSNIGDDRNWCGHPFAQANWYAFGRLAWNPSLKADDIASEWVRQTFTSDPQAVTKIVNIMMGSREAFVNYETPLGLSHLINRDHYNPFPGTNHAAPEVNSYFYHRSDAIGIGVDRTSTGSKAVNCYQPGERDLLADLKTCPENLLLWFHHVPWDYSMASGHTLWDDLCLHYQSGVDWVKQTQKTWSELSGSIDADRYQLVAHKLDIQEKDSVHWRNVCLTYFQTFSKRPYPPGVEVQPETVH